MKETDLTEFNKLEQMLKNAGIPYEREDVERVPREEVIRLGLHHYFDWHQFRYMRNGRKVSDVVIFYGSYGFMNGLLEQMGLLPPCGDSVQGYLTAEEVFERWKAHYEKEDQENG